MTETAIFFLLIFLGGIAGFMNVLAGGGSALTVPFLIFLGYDPTVANGSNRIAIMVEAMMGIGTFKKHSLSDFPQSFKLGLMTLPGAIIGAFYAVKIDDERFTQILGVVMILVVASLLFPKKNVAAHAESHPWSQWLSWPAMFAVGFYGGFIQAGVGFMIMATLLHLFRMDLLMVNVHKVFITAMFTLPAVIFFIWTGNVDWFAAIGLSIGMAMGTWLAVKAAIKRGETIIRIMLGVALLVIGVKLMFF